MEWSETAATTKKLKRFEHPNSIAGRCCVNCMRASCELNFFESKNIQNDKRMDQISMWFRFV